MKLTLVSPCWRRNTLVCFLLLASTLPVFAGLANETPQRVKELQSVALQDELAWELLSSLTTDVGPRMGGSPGDALAVAWAQQQMQRLGFDRVWLEPVEFPLWLRRSESVRIAAPRKQEMAVTALGGSPATDGVLSAPVVHFADLAAGRIFQFRSRVSETAGPAMGRLADWLAPLGIPHQQDEPAGGGADIGQMRKLGMPVVDLDHDATRYFDYHHTANDTLDKVDPDDLSFNVAAYVTFIYFAAETDVVFGPVEGE